MSRITVPRMCSLNADLFQISFHSRQFRAPTLGPQPSLPDGPPCPLTDFRRHKNNGTASGATKLLSNCHLPVTFQGVLQ